MTKYYLSLKNINEIAKKYEKDCKGKVALIGASIDDSDKVVQKHLKKTKWTAVNHLLCTGNTADNFMIEAVPTAVLIHKGKIVFYGHPVDLDIEAKVKELLGK